MYKLNSDSLIKTLVMKIELNILFNREINKYITHKMDMFTW